MNKSIVLHVDMDAFFAAVEERDNPRLSGKPIVVGADPKNGAGRGVVSTASYAARVYGVHSAMPISRAWELCRGKEKSGAPACVFLPVNFEKYEAASARIMEILRAHASAFEQVSIDEAYLTPKNQKSSASPARSAGRAGGKSQIPNYKEAEFIARSTKDEIRKKERLTCSVGIGPNKLIAKIASDTQKPDGLTVVLPPRAQNFLDSLPARVIPGIGPKTEYRLKEQFGVSTIRELRNIARAELLATFGSWGNDMWERARGIDERPVEEPAAAQSFGRQETFETDTADAMIVMEKARELALRVAQDVHDASCAYGTVELTVRFADFETHTRAETLPHRTSDVATLERYALKLLLPFLDRRKNPKGKRIRLIGVRVSRLSPISS